MRDAREDPKTQVVAVRRNPTKTSTARSLCCAVYKCEPKPGGVKIKGLGRVKPQFFLKKSIDKPVGRCYNKYIIKKKLS